MSTLTREDVDDLLRALADMGSYGRAESEPEEGFLRRFLPLPEHARALDPDVFLIIGERGAGKTELFRALIQRSGLQAIRNVGVRTAGLPSAHDSAWIVGYSTSGADFPPELAFREFASDKQPSDLQLVWLGLLVQTLHRANEFGRHSIPLPTPVVRTDHVDVEALFQATRRHLAECFTALDQLDSRLSQSGRWIFVSYDELDRVSASDWDRLRTILRGLVQFWSSYVRRWKRLRPKIFLRRDLFDLAALFGPDISKITPQRVELVWSVRNLYALVVKRLVNHDELLARYVGCEDWNGKTFDELGWMPLETSDRPYRALIERMCGEYMGAGPTKGRSFTWIPNHLQDSNRRVMPRSMVRFFECAARIEQDNRRSQWPQLLHHTSLRAAIDQVSLSRVQEIEDEEFPWIGRIRQKLASAHPQVPLDRRELERLLVIDWTEEKDRPPETSGHGVLRLLMDLGIFYLRGDGRVDVRDLYLRGFGLKRKGGVARPY